MDMNSYQVIGFALILLSGIFLFAFVFYNLRVITSQSSMPSYQKKMPKVTFPNTFCLEIQEAYKKTENMRGMLELLKVKYPKGNIYKRILIAEDYLLHSRYRDFETTLFKYLSDGSFELEKLYKELICQEVMKRRRLPCKM